MTVRAPNEQEEKLKLEAAEMLEIDRVRLLMDQPFIGAFLIRQNLIPVVDSRCDTAATDGQNIFVNPEFYLSMAPAERRFLLAHEVWHTVLLHFLRRKDRNRELFNIATDMEINEMLRFERFKIPEGALLPPRDWHGLNAEEIYERLLESEEPLEETIDIHLEPDDDASGSGDGSGDGKSAGTDEDGSKDIVEDPDFDVDFGTHPEDKVREMVIEAATQCEKRRGKLPGKAEMIVENFRSGKLHWKELLAQFVTSCFGGSRRWLPPNRRYISSGLYLQSRRDSKLKAVLAVDTSGSTHADLPRFASELSNLLNSFGNYELQVICCDAKIQSVENYSSVAPFDGNKFVFSGGGGTSFKPVFEYLKTQNEAPDLLIYFTDGIADVPEKPTYPVMWVITPDGRNNIPWGYEAKMD
ncbi:MAG: hypothetical protein J6S24_00860 [Lentisphaeria bacterium]|nr:hypothetical protein [Lentisphaeria bacterium]